MTTPQRHMHLGLFVHALGHHVAGWRHPDARGHAENIHWFVELAQTAERGLFDLFFVGDALTAGGHGLPSTTARLEPLTMLSAVSIATKHIGLAATLSTTFGDPFHAARAFASLDHISDGRAAWNVVTSFSDDVARNFGQAKLISHSERYARAREFVDVVRGLWDGWEDGAFLADKESGVYLDKTKIHSLDHDGEYYSVAGPLNISRCPQGNPVLIQAGSSAEGQQLAAEIADVVFTAQVTLEEARQFYGLSKQHVAKVGRPPERVMIMPGVMPFVGRSRAEAEDTYELLQGWIDIESGLSQLSRRFGIDLRQYPLDGPLPEIPLTEGGQSRVRLLTEMAERENLSIRQLAATAAASRGHRAIIGSPAEVADDLEEWFSSGAADGFIVMPPYLPGGLDSFVDLVVPELQRRGLFRTEYGGTTLRHHLGLPRPQGRSATS